MTYLLDTNATLWALYNSRMLTERAKNIIENEDCTISIISLWEIAIKNALGKLGLAHSIKQIADTFEDYGIPILQLTPEDCDVMKSLPFIHRDPFDRIIISQALNHNYTLVTSDTRIPQYDVRTVWK